MVDNSPKSAPQPDDELRRAQKELLDFVETARIGLHWVGPDGTILWANPAELQLLGYSREEYIGRHIAEFHADAPVIDDILHRLTGDEILCEYPARLVCKDGSIRDVLIDSSVYRVDGAFIHTRCFTRDITEQRRAEKKLEATLQELMEARDVAEQANLAKSQFLANVSHELRTPLNAIIGYAELLQEDSQDRGELKATEDLQKILYAGKHLMTVIGDILDLSRIEAGKLELNLEVLNAAEVAKEAAMLAAPLAEQNGNGINVATSGDCPYVLADYTRLRQVLFNLLSNAAKFTTDGQIRIECRLADTDDEELAEICVTDNGTGMNEEQLSQLFEPFVQLDASPARRHGGTGLGLAISRRLMDLMSGSITVTSTPGEGTTFCVRLPVACPAPQEAG
ncbi:MAG: PAS domain-containing sensor histidine kinase [Candidatus Sumerlaeaceae bacterium]